jgi:2-polyprenyl-3-methyl-5-hydroxy-6-metoxy-1,4-benzoquinol methylase
MTAATVDQQKLREAARHLAGFYEGAAVSAMVYVGDALGLYRAMRGAGALTSAELAERTGLHERWLREWLQGQAVARILAYHGEGRFELTPEMGTALADEDSPYSVVGMFDNFPGKMGAAADVPESFRTGLGRTFDDRGEEGARAVERMLGIAHRTMLVQAFLPAMEGVVAKLEGGATVADVGCGAGVAIIEMAKAFPASLFQGFDISNHALARARENAATAGAKNATFHNAAAEPLPEAPTFDLVCTFDCLHDMTHPEVVAAAIRRAMKDDGSWLIADIDGAPTFEGNIEKQGAASMYANSVLGCMSSSLSEPGGAGLGTLGLPEPKMRELVGAAGFTRFRRLPVRHPINAYYEVRP